MGCRAMNSREVSTVDILTDYSKINALRVVVQKILIS
jgi:hypothetical protein